MRLMLMRIMLRIINIFTLIKFKIIYGKKFSFHWSDRVSPSLKIRINGEGRICFGRNVILKENVIFNVSAGGEIILSDNVFINDFSCINSREYIYIGNNTIIGQGVKIYDHNHDYQGLNKISEYKSGRVIICDNVWIGSDVVILNKSLIENGCVIGAMSLVNSLVESGNLYYNIREKKTLKVVINNEV